MGHTEISIKDRRVLKCRNQKAEYSLSPHFLRFLDGVWTLNSISPALIVSSLIVLLAPLLQELNQFIQRGNRAYLFQRQKLILFLNLLNFF